MTTKPQTRNTNVAREMIQRESWNRDDLERFLGATGLRGIGGKLPTASGFDEDGEPFWLTADVREWLVSDQVLQVRHKRAAGSALDEQQRFHAHGGTVRASSVDEAARTVQATIATESRIAVFDFRRGETVDEILVMDGATVPDQIPILDSHQRNTTRDVLGKCENIRRDGSVLVGRLQFSPDQRSNEVFAKVRDNFLDSVSIGYRNEEFVEIMPGETKTVLGRSYTNDGSTYLRVVSKWSVHEVSVVAIGADDNAKIRKQHFPVSTKARGNSMPATIQQTRRALGRPESPQEIAAGLAERCGLSDPSRCRQFSEQDAERGHRHANEPFHRILKFAAELDGIEVDGGSSSEIVRAIDSARQRGFSTASIDAMFNQATAAIVESRVNDAEDSTRGWCGEAFLPDYKQHIIANVSSTGLQLRPRGSNAAHAEYSASGETVQLHEYFKQFVMDEQDLIDAYGDEKLRQIWENASGFAADLRSNLVYSTLRNNAAMADGTALFHADHSNLQTSSTITEDNLQAATAAMANQKNAAGINLNLQARYIVVPPALTRTAQSLSRSTNVGDGHSTPPLIVRSDPRLSGELVDPITEQVLAADNTSWMLANGSHGLTCFYLRDSGNKPQVRTGQLPKSGQFGFWVRVVYPMAVAAIDYRGLQKCAA